MYFLSIVCNSFAGYVLFSGIDSETGENSRFSVKNPVFFLVLGILCVVTGVLKLLSPWEGILFLGDIIPAAGGIIAGLMLIFGIYRKDTFSKSGELERISVNLLAFRKPIGVGLLAIALMHFLFPQVLFL